MHHRYLSATLIGLLACTAAPALAWDGRSSARPATSHMPPIWAYPSKQNYCPAGLQPVVVGGVICCGTPTHAGYRAEDHPRPRRAQKPRAKTWVATGKGYGEGYYE